MDTITPIVMLYRHRLFLDFNGLQEVLVGVIERKVRLQSFVHVFGPYLVHGRRAWRGWRGLNRGWRGLNRGWRGRRGLNRGRRGLNWGRSRRLVRPIRIRVVV